jgi:hypothetical protein
MVASWLEKLPNSSQVRNFADCPIKFVPDKVLETVGRQTGLEGKPLLAE